jgi:hypothetical protein
METSKLIASETTHTFTSQTPHCWHLMTRPLCMEGQRWALPGSSLLSTDPTTSSDSWDSSSSTDAPPKLPTITNYNSPTICIMLLPLPLLVSKILLNYVSLTRDSPSQQGRLWLVLNGHVRERNLGCSFLGKKSRFYQMTCKGHVRNSCMPNSVLHYGCFFSFRWRHPIPENKNKEYVKNTQFSSTIYLPAVLAIH